MTPINICSADSQHEIMKLRRFRIETSKVQQPSILFFNQPSFDWKILKNFSPMLDIFVKPGVATLQSRILDLQTSDTAKRIQNTAQIDNICSPKNKCNI